MAMTRAQREAAERLRRNNEYLEEKHSGKGAAKKPVYKTGNDEMSVRPKSYKTASQARWEARNAQKASAPERAPYSHNAYRNQKDQVRNVDPYAWQERGNKPADFKPIWSLTGIFDALDTIKKDKERKADSVSLGARQASSLMKQQGGEIAAIDRDIAALSSGSKKESATKESALKTMLAEDDPVVIRGKQAVDAMANGIVTDQIKADAEAYRKLQEQHTSSPVGSQRAALNADKKFYSDAYDAAGYQYAAQSAADYKENVARGAQVASDVNRVLNGKYTPLDTLRDEALGGRDTAAYIAMTRDEIDTYRYWLAKNKDVADRYIKHLKPQLIERASDIVDQNIEDVENEGLKKVVRGLTTVAGSGKNVGRSIRNIPAAIAGSEDVESAGIVERGQQKMAQRLEGVEKGVNDFIYNMIPMIPTAAVSMAPGAGAALSAGYTAARTYGGTYADTVQQGYAPGEAQRYALANAASEAGMQYLLGGIANTGGSKSLSSALQRAAQKAAKNPAAAKGLSILGNMGSEAAEEYLQENLDPVMQNIILDENNELNPVSQDKWEAAVMGALMALVMNAPSDISGGVRTVQSGRAYNSPDVMQALVQEGLASNPDTSAYGQAQRLAGKLEAGKNASNFEAGSLAQANEAAISAEARANAVLDKAGVQRAYDPNETVKLKDGREVVIVARDGSEYTAIAPGENGYTRITIDEILHRESVRRAVDAYLHPEDKADIAGKYNHRHVEKTADQTFLDKLVAGRGVKAVIGDLPQGAEAFYNQSTNTIHFAPDSTRADVIGGVTAHELAHAAEASEHYKAYSDYAVQRLFGNDTDALRQAVEAKQEQYVRRGIDLSDADAVAEIVADYTRNLYKSEADIEALVTGSRGMAQSIYDSIRTAIRKIRAFFKGDEAALRNIREYQDLRRAQRLFERALSAMPEAQAEAAIIPQTDGDVNRKYSIKEESPQIGDADIPAGQREYIPKPMDDAAPAETEQDQQARILAGALKEGNTITPEEFRAASLIHKDAAAEFEAVDKRLGLSEQEKKAGRQIARGDYDLSKFNGDPKVLEWAKAYEKRGNAEQVMHKYRTDLRKTAREHAMEVIASSDTWKDKKLGISYATETAYRNNIDVAGKNDAEGAQRLQREYFDPISENEAKATRYISGLNEKIKALNLNKAEAVLVQAYGEGLISGADLLGYAREPFKEITFRNEDSTYQKKFKKSQEIDADKVKRAAHTFRGIYDELMGMANDARVRNGYAPIMPRANYFPHFNEMTTKEKALAAFGIDITGVDAIPEGIAGITEFFKPGTKWFANFQQRKGNQTAFDAVEGFDGYIRGIKDVIFHTDDIQRLRALETALRSRHADETIQKKIDEINADPMRTSESKQSDIQELLKNVKDSNLSNYISWLHEYTNGLAGKKSTLDRAMEQMGNRKAYTVMRKLQGRVASNMIGYNVGSWLTNFIPLTQAHGQIKTVNMLKGIKDTIKNWAKSDGFVQGSDFLVNRRGTDALSKDALQKFSDAGVKPMEWIDQFVSETIVRAKYSEEMKAGSTPEEAMRSANQTAANILADRSYGQMPTLFNAKNPLVKTLTMFQLEVNNQYRNLFKDLPRSAKGSGGKAALTIALGLLKYCVGAWLYNEMYEKMTGRRAAFDPIGIVQSAAKDFSDENMSKAQATTNLVSDVAEQIPFVGGLIGGGRVPVSSAIPFGGSLTDIAKNIGDVATGSESAKDKLGKELLKPVWYIAPPGGGGAAKKAVEGAQTIAKGGEYGVDKDGNRKLKFSTDGDGIDILRALVFGKYATEGGQEYVNGGFKGLSTGHTAAHTNLVNGGVKPQRAEEIIKNIAAVEGDRDENGDLIKGSAGKKLIAEIDKLTDLDATQKYRLYYDMVWTDSLKKDMDAAIEDYGIGEMTLINAYKNTYGIKGDKDENGETISGTKGKKVRDAIDRLALSGSKEQKERQRAFLYEMFGGGKSAAAKGANNMAGATIPEAAGVENTSATTIPEAAGYDIPNYKGDTLTKISSIGVTPEDYAYIDDRISAKEDRVAYLQELGFDGKQLSGLVENFVMGKTAKGKMRVAEEDMNIDNGTYIDAYIFGYSSVGSKSERNAQIRDYVNGLSLSDEQKDALYGWVKVSRGKTKDGKQTGGSSGGSSRRGRSGRMSSGRRSSVKSAAVSQEIPDAVWNELRANVKTPTIKSSNPVWETLEALLDRGDKIREETMQQELAAVDATPYMSSAWRAERKREIRKRYERGIVS